MKAAFCNPFSLLVALLVFLAGCSSSTPSNPLCGNGQIDENETCDPKDTCPKSCDDSNACTEDLMTGSASNCNVACSHEIISACLDSDGCCPAGCNAAGDPDCSPTCGDGHVDENETCDPQNTCPTGCDDSDDCTEDLMTGSAANCNVACSHGEITACGAAEGCCPAGCLSLDDDDCPEPTITGWVSAYETTTYGYSATANASAAFRAVGGSETPMIEIGECLVYVYDPDYQPTYPPGLNAGSVTLTGTIVSPVTLTAAWSEQSGWYYQSSLPSDNSDLFHDGDQIHISVAGGDGVPAYSATITAVAALQGVTPDLFASGYFYNPRDPLSFQWTAGGASITLVVTAYLYQNYTLVAGASVICTTDDDGAFSVPQEALDYLPSDGNWIAVTLSRTDYEIAEVGGARYSVGSTKTLSRFWNNIGL